MDFQLSLQTEPVSSAYPQEPLAIAASASLADAFQLMRAQRTGALLVYDRDELKGIFTERDALRLMAAKADLAEPVSSAMSTELTTVQSDSTLNESIHLMAEGGFRHLPMVCAEKGTPIGMVDAPGVMHYLVDHFPETIYNLPPEAGRSPAEREGA